MHLLEKTQTYLDTSHNENIVNIIWLYSLQILTAMLC